MTYSHISFTECGLRSLGNPSRLLFAHHQRLENARRRPEPGLFGSEVLLPDATGTLAARIDLTTPRQIRERSYRRARYDTFILAPPVMQKLGFI